MKKVQKGEAGYTHYRKMKLGLISLIGFVLVILSFSLGYITTGTPKNYVSILSVLIVLPTAKFFVQYIMIPHSLKVDEGELKRIGEKAGNLKIYSELLVTASEKTFELLYLVIDKDENVVAYTRNTKSDSEKFEKGITNFLNYYQYNAKPVLYNDFEKFLEHVSTMNKETDEHTGEIFEKISIMSI